MNKEIMAISLFSGAGGLDIASMMAGIPVAVSTDFDSDCIQTLHKNDIFRNTEIIQGDLRDIKSSHLKDITLKNKADKVIVIGGAPCQPFSKAGYWVGNDTRQGINDPRAALVDEYLRVVTDVQPDGFVFENVESLLHPTNKSIIENFLKIIESSAYSYKVIRANALEYGVSQRRKRIFIIGTKGTFKSDAPIKTHCAKNEVDKTGLNPYVNAGDVIAGYEGNEYAEAYEVTLGGTYHDDLCQVPPGMNYKALTAWAGYENPKFVADKRFWSFLLKLSPTEPSWTIMAQPGPWVGPFHWTNRRLRTPEIAAIQSFPKDYNFVGNRRSVQKQIGNAVPPLMGKAMIEFLKESLTSHAS
ncbi:MAG: DNA cytosine methyltransferase [Oscillospiraceae bacterium]|nr:DNA cytosine methyltransferase [Oscillospiraceae bacterium]